MGKIYSLISWSRICTLLILASASLKMASTSATVICNKMRVDVCKFNQVNEYESITKLKKGSINLRRTNI